MTSHFASWVTAVSTLLMAIVVGFQAWQTREILDDHLEGNVQQAELEFCVDWNAVGRSIEPWMNGVGFGIARLSGDAEVDEHCLMDTSRVRWADEIEKMENSVYLADLVLPKDAEMKTSQMLGGVSAFSQYLRCSNISKFTEQKKSELLMNVALLQKEWRRISQYCRAEFQGD